MKKNYFLSLLFLLSFVGIGHSQELLLNGTFENWDNDNSPTDWTKAENVTKESTEIHGGAFSVKHSASGTKDISQTIGGIIAGESYTIVLWYKVTSGDGTDARIWSYWKDVNNSNIDNNDFDSKDAIRGPSNNYLDNNDGVWSKYETTITAPVGATQFYFELRVYGSAVVYWDDLSFKRNVTSTSPEILITSPANGAVLDNVTNTSVTVSINNFNLSADNGSGVSDNSGDGYIKSTFSTEGGTTENSNYFSTTIPDVAVSPGNTYTLTFELVDNAGNSLNPKVESTSTFSVTYPCDIQLTTINATCDANTSGIDTYTTTINFTGGNTGTTYTITAKDANDATVGTIGGDNPNTMATGTISITGVSEGTNFTVQVVGGQESSCDFTRSISSPSCVSFPIIEEFDYALGANLGEQSTWTNANSGDEILVTSGNLDYTGLKKSIGNKVAFDGAGMESYKTFTNITSGTVYASFLLKVTSFQTSASPDLTDGGYIAALAGSISGYDARFWVRPNPDTSGTTYDIGFGAETSSPPFTTNTYNLNEVIFVVIAYNMDDKIVSTWINPDVSSFEGTIPTPTITGTDPSPPSVINLFILRQDSTEETPFIEIDALRISTNWSDVTPKDATASTKNNPIEGFATYPNPVTNNRFTITSNSVEKKEVTIFNVLGKKVLSTSFLGTKSDIIVAGISAGIYILKVSEGSKTATSKLIIR